jgi:hypothetical protein
METRGESSESDLRERRVHNHVHGRDREARPRTRSLDDEDNALYADARVACVAAH